MCGEGPDGRARANGNGGKTISSHSQHATRPSPLVRHWFSTSRILRSRSCVYFVPPYYSLYTISIYSLLHRQSVKFFPFDRELTHRKGVVIISIAAINSPFLLFFTLLLGAPVWFSFLSFFFWPSVDQQHQFVVPNFPLCEVFMSRLPILFLIIFSFTNKKPWWNQTPKGGRRPFAVSITTRLESTRRAAPVPYWYGRCMCAQHRRRGEPAIQSINHDQAD